VPFGDAPTLSKALSRLVNDAELRNGYRRRAYEFGRQMTWPCVARSFASCLDEACRDAMPVRFTRKAVPKETTGRVRLSLPEPRLDHLDRMTDDTGLIQHATHAVPNRLHGYSIDDVARGLIVVAMHHSLFREHDVLKHFHTYLSYILHARLDNGRFHNFLSYDRRWLDTVGSDDSQGRVLWSLGFVVAHAPDDSSRQLCRQLFDQSLHTLDDTAFIRPRAFAILGCYDYLSRFPDAVGVRDVMRHCADGLVEAFDRFAGPGWPWCASAATYDNARISQAMILAGIALEETRYREFGIKSLDWLLDVQRGDGGQISLIGNNGWLKRNGPKPPFDQQPVEIAALVAACQAAHRATGDVGYLTHMRRCFDWFLGSNDLGIPMVDFKSRGCYDGLLPSGVNQNQGAESLVSWLLSLLAMHEIQTADQDSAG